MRYIKIQFTKGLDGYAYQVVDERGLVTAYLDEKGGSVDLFDKDGKELVYEARVVEDNVTPPFPVVNEAAVTEPVPEEAVAVVDEQMPSTVDELEEKIRAIIAESK